MNDIDPVFRFAPSPNGELHLGHAYSALVNHRMAREAGGRFLLRYEDIDQARCTPAYAAQIADDLAFLDIEWDKEPRHQAKHFHDYSGALQVLVDAELVYPAFLSRGEVRAHADAHLEMTGNSWPYDPDGAPLYPSLDRDLSTDEREAKMRGGEKFAWRLDMTRATERAGPLAFDETGGSFGGETGTLSATPGAWGDVVLARMDVPTSYHLAVVVDDALQGVTDVVRGRDLFASTSVHVLLQALLGLPTPRYHHHDLILGGDGRKLSKSGRDTSLKTLRGAGVTGDDIRRMVGLPPRPASQSFGRDPSGRGPFSRGRSATG